MVFLRFTRFLASSNCDKTYSLLRFYTLNVSLTQECFGTMRKSMSDSQLHQCIAFSNNGINTRHAHMANLILGAFCQVHITC